MRKQAWVGVTVLVTGLALGGLAARQPGEKPRPGNRLTPGAVRGEEKAIREAAGAFSAAYNKGDLDALLALWSPEGEYVAANGKTYRGKAQLRALLTKALAAARGQKHSISIDRIRFLRPDVAQEEGSITLASPAGEEHKGSYVALWLKVDGKWLLGSVRDVHEPADENRPAAYQRLRVLGWLVGDWQEKGGDATLSVRWAPGQAFLVLRWHVKRGDEQLQVEQRIGWDPASGQIRSWLFDSTGGFGEGAWQREGNTWSVHGEGVYPDGRPARSLHTWKFVDRDSFHWAARERTVDDLPLPDTDAVYVRKNGTRGEGR